MVMTMAMAMSVAAVAAPHSLHLWLLEVQLKPVSVVPILIVSLEQPLPNKAADY